MHPLTAFLAQDDEVAPDGKGMSTKIFAGCNDGDHCGAWIRHEEGGFLKPATLSAALRQIANWLDEKQAKNPLGIPGPAKEK